MRYIETHLDSRMDVAGLASEACMSPYHFHRQFTHYVGMPVMGYIRSRRMATAFDMLGRDVSGVLAASLDLGYETPEAFAKAFKRHFGVPPSTLKKQGIQWARLWSMGGVVLHPCRPEGANAAGAWRDPVRELPEPADGFSYWLSVFPDTPKSCGASGESVGASGESVGADVKLSKIHVGGSAYWIRYPKKGAAFHINHENDCAVMYENKTPMPYRRYFPPVSRSCRDTETGFVKLHSIFCLPCNPDAPPHHPIRLNE